ncbi:MAG: phospho-sugar mutase [Clostridia bacterium]|nr:phospho-sugar mutase [Clostridia bacterium]MDD4048551.1 phospho-sugar mutase [Clostridia bacterium]
MNQYLETYQKWKEQLTNNKELYGELTSIESKPMEIKERFHKYLEFGTGGLRGIIGAGINRMNIYTIRKTSQGLANCLNKIYPSKDKKVVIAYDSRYKSKEFALESALVLIQNGIKAYVFENITPTPLLSYAVVKLEATAGIVVTASHNPKEYNGYKVYWEHGGQITDALAMDITEEINNITNEFEIDVAERSIAEKEKQLIWIKDDLLNSYIQETKQLVLNESLMKYATDLKIVYTPLHGSGLVPFTKLLKEVGFTNIHLVKEQIEADPSFPTVICPNPEEPAACELAVKLAHNVDADIILATDPDADRVGLTIKDSEGNYLHLTGNQTGALLIDYILQMRFEKGTLPSNGLIIKTIVTSEMGAAIAKAYGIKHIDVLTGFKYIGEKVAEFAKTGSNTFLFGYEESYGYLFGSHVRDKDAIQTCLMIAEMALYYKNKGLLIQQRLEQLFEKYGYFQEALVNINLKGFDGQERLERIMEYFRVNHPHEIEGSKITVIKDYLLRKEINCRTQKKERLTLPCSNVLQYFYENGSWCCIRPSGTEPKLKIYFGVKGKNQDDANQQLLNIKKTFLNIVNNID